MALRCNGENHNGFSLRCSVTSPRQDPVRRGGGRYSLLGAACGGGGGGGGVPGLGPGQAAGRPHPAAQLPGPGLLLLHHQGHQVIHPGLTHLASTWS
jgi:hypothetical protein